MLNAIVSISFAWLIYWYWQQAQKLKNLALQTAKARCQLLELLMLDDYVALTHLGLRKNATGVWQILRCYSFEFASTGEERYQGVCTLLGHRVQSIEMGAYRIE